jgi:Gly-Xaa carboxypeptidase
MSKPELPTIARTDPPSISRFSCLRKAVVVTLALSGAAVYLYQPAAEATLDFVGSITSLGEPTGAACRRAEPLVPKHTLRASLDELYATQAFTDKSAEWLGGAVRVP